jgi:hypothetical protein
MRGSWVLLPVLAVTAVCLAASGFHAIDNLLFLRTAATADGRVVANREKWTHGRGGWSVFHVPVVRYADPSGVEREVESSEDYPSPTNVGTSVPVHFRPEDPTSARLGGSFLWTRCWRRLIPGLIGLLVFGSLIVVSRRLTWRRVTSSTS